MSQNASFSPSPNPNNNHSSSSNAGLRMSNEELLSRCSNWTLACDNALLNRLRDFSENLETSARELSTNCDLLSKDVSTLQFKISNITNEFLMLADTRFVENRVQEFEECNIVDKKSSKQVVILSKAEKEAALIEKMKESIQIGVGVHQERMKLRPLATEYSLTTSTDSRFTSSVNLAHLIGSSKFFSSKYCGLVNEDSRLGYGTAATVTIADNSVASSSTSGSSSSQLDVRVAVGANATNNNDSEKLIFPDFESAYDDDIFDQGNRVQTVSTNQIPPAQGTPHMYSDYPKVLPDIGNMKSGPGPGFGSESSTNVTPPRPPPFPTEFSNSIPPPPHLSHQTSPPSPSSSTSSSFFEGNSAVTSEINNLFKNQQTAVTRSVTITPPETPDPDFRPPPVLDVSSSDDEDIFSSSRTANRQKSSGIQSHFANQSVPSYAYNQNIFHQPPPEPTPTVTMPITPTATVTVPVTVTTTATATLPSSIPKMAARTNQPFLEELKSKVNHSSEGTMEGQKARSSELFQSKAMPNFSQPKDESNVNIYLPKQAEAGNEPTVTVPQQEPESTKIPQQHRPTPFQLPQLPKRTSIFDDSDSDDDLFSNMSSKPSKTPSLLFKPPPSSSSESKNVGNRNQKSNAGGDFNFNSDLRPPRILDLSENESEDDDDIFKSLRNSSKVGLGRNDSFLRSISPPVPVHETIRDASGDKTSTNHVDFQSPVVSSPTQNQNHHRKQQETVYVNDSDPYPKPLEATASKSQSDTQSQSFASLHSDVIPTNSYGSVPPPASIHSSFKNRDESQQKIQPEPPLKSENVTPAVKEITTPAAIVSTIDTDFFDAEFPNKHIPDLVEGNQNELKNALDTGSTKVTIINSDLPRPSFGSVMIPPANNLPPSPTLSTEAEDEDDNDIFTSHRRRSQEKPPIKTETTPSVPAITTTSTIPDPAHRVPVHVQEPTPVPLHIPAPVTKSELKPKFQSQNVDRLKSKSIFDSSDSDDDLFSTKPKSFTSSSTSFKDVSPQPQPKHSIFRDEPSPLLEQPPPPPKSEPKSKPVEEEPPPFISHGPNQGMSVNNHDNIGQKGIEDDEAILRRPPPILDMSDEDSDDDLFKSMSIPQTQTSWQQPEIKIIGGVSKASQSTSSTALNTPTSVQTPVPHTVLDPNISATDFGRNEGDSNGFLQDSKKESNPSVEVPVPTPINVTTTSSVSVLALGSSVTTVVLPQKVDSIFGAKLGVDTKPQIAIAKSKVAKEKSIFESSDSDDDLFSTKTKTVTVKSIKSVSASASTPAVPTAVSFGKSPVGTSRQANASSNTASKKSTKSSLFDDSDDDDASDLFKGGSTQKFKTNSTVLGTGFGPTGLSVLGSGSGSTTIPIDSSDNALSQDFADGSASLASDSDTTDFKKINALQSRSNRALSVTGTGTGAPGHGLDGQNPRDKIFGAVTKSLENIFSAKNTLRVASKTNLSSNFCDSVSFDEEVSTQNLLHCVTKDRPKISHQRRPPSLKRRQFSKSTSSLLTPNPDTNELDPLV